MLNFGIFDHLDDDGSELGPFLERRLRLIELIERAGEAGAFDLEIALREEFDRAEFLLAAASKAE